MDRNRHQLFVFMRAMEFLSIQDSFKVLLLNKYFYQNVLESGGYRILSLKILDFFEDRPVTEENCYDCLESYIGVRLSNFEDLYNCIKQSFNIFKNPCGEDKFNNWHKHNGGNGWIIDSWHCWKDKKTVFVGSYGWCRLVNDFSISPSDKDRILIVGSPVAKRYDCHSTAEVIVKLTNDSDNTTDHSQRRDLKGSDKYELLFVTIKLEKHASYQVKASFNSKDLQFWAGHYGARFGYIFARVFNIE